MPKRNFLIFTALVTLANIPSFGQGKIDDRRLLNENFWARGSVYGERSTYTKIDNRAPKESEKSSVNFANFLMDNNSNIKLLLLIDKGKIVFERYNHPANPYSAFHGYSVTKTLTSFAIGQAICEKLIDINEKIGAIDTGFVKTQYENATIKDLLTMASGAKSPDPDSSFKAYTEVIDNPFGKLKSLRQTTIETTISEPRKGLFSDFKPGEIFDYKSSDPVVLSIAFTSKTNINLGSYLHEKILIPAGVNGRFTLAEDHDGIFAATYGARLMPHDWARFAIWTRNKLNDDSCLGNYIREASTTKIKNIEKKFGRAWQGYGYFIWTDNNWQQNSFWALGYGGQRIIWNHTNEKIIVAFSILENWDSEAGKLYSMWSEAL